MRYALFVLSILLPVAAAAQAPTVTIDEGMAAEGASRFDVALAIYNDALRQDPTRTDLWIRVADIHARLGRQEECIGALTQAAAASPSDMSIYVRLSEAYAQAAKPDAALAAIEVALTLAPDSVDLLRRRAVLATWSGSYGHAQKSYRRLLELQRANTEWMIGLARVSAWAGDTDIAVRMYRNYLSARPTAPDVWLELARAEAWRGNFAESWDVLDQYRARFGESPEYSRERAGVLARGGRPRAATPLIERLLVTAPDDYGLNLSRTVALAALHRRSDALAASGTVEQRWPDRPETQGVRGAVRAAVASTGEPRFSFYGDSDGLAIRRIDPRVSVAIGNGTRLDGGYDRTDLRARAGSGLEQFSGATQALHQSTWIGIAQRAGRLTVRGQGGYATLGSTDRFSYTASAQLVSDSVRLSAARESGFFVVSPRTVGLGLTRLSHRAQFEWTPSFRYEVAIDGTVDALSDGNRRWDLLLVSRRTMARTQRLNLDLGLQLRQFGTTLDLDNGYYDPSRYENYSVTVFPYWKIADNTGVAGVFAVGLQRDQSSRSFGLGGNAAVEATVGIYREWMVKLNGSVTLNDRLQSGAFRGYGGQAVLVRRF